MPVSVTAKAISGCPVADRADLQQLLADVHRHRCSAWLPPAGWISSSTAPDSVNFTALDSRLRSTCCSRCSSVCRVAGSSERDLDGEVEALVGGQRTECRLDVVDQLHAAAIRAGRTSILPASTLDRSRMSLISWSRSEPARVDGLGELDLLGRRGCRSALSEQQLGQDQQAVERGAQLVGHVGEELRLVLRGERELLRALLQHLPGLLDLGFLISMSRFCVASSSAFSSSSRRWSCWSSSCRASRARRSAALEQLRRSARCDSQPSRLLGAWHVGR